MTSWTMMLCMSHCSVVAVVQGSQWCKAPTVVETTIDGSRIPKKLLKPRQQVQVNTVFLIVQRCADFLISGLAAPVGSDQRSRQGLP